MKKVILFIATIATVFGVTLWLKARQESLGKAHAAVTGMYLAAAVVAEDQAAPETWTSHRSESGEHFLISDHRAMVLAGVPAAAGDNKRYRLTLREIDEETARSLRESAELGILSILDFLDIEEVESPETPEEPAREIPRPPTEI
jgi:hypothetical protein